MPITVDFVTLTVLTNVFGYTCELFLEKVWSYISVKSGRADFKTYVEADYIEKFLPFRTFRALFTSRFGFLAGLCTVSLAMSTFISPLVQLTINGGASFVSPVIQLNNVTKGMYYGPKPYTTASTVLTEENFKNALGLFAGVADASARPLSFIDCAGGCIDPNNGRILNVYDVSSTVSPRVSISIDLDYCSNTTTWVCFNGVPGLYLDTPYDSISLYAPNTYSGIHNLTNDEIFAQDTFIGTLATDTNATIAFGVRVSYTMELTNSYNYSVLEADKIYNYGPIQYSQSSSFSDWCNVTRSYNEGSYAVLELGCYKYLYRYKVETYVLANDPLLDSYRVSPYDDIDGNIISPMELQGEPNYGASFRMAAVSVGNFAGNSSLSTASLSNLVKLLPITSNFTLYDDAMSIAVVVYSTVPYFLIPDGTLVGMLTITLTVLLSLSMYQLSQRATPYLMNQFTLLEASVTDGMCGFKSKFQHQHKWFSSEVGKHQGFSVDGKHVTLQDQGTIYYDAVEMISPDEEKGSYILANHYTEERSGYLGFISRGIVTKGIGAVAIRNASDRQQEKTANGDLTFRKPSRLRQSSTKRDYASEAIDAVHKHTGLTLDDTIQTPENNQGGTREDIASCEHPLSDW
ncbi:hypothetical protein K450DRAFT_263962 [Umbelopsis ramanniana AG]|uniref:Uncharacterized protein n=1 Tax=Umbelopsis ramanniana AG TaxID=1314678 RepID=A0AAD5DYA1_UMBRA|nr:uncharacterized protein K450DRAFT_263962 [Umbelopsis ramanniana AG]KAI8574963.1 hypothetical protein K450DRAFT_263962 [Umbelopsis ramanniana AG]